MLKPIDAQSVPSLMLKRELESVRRELRSLKRRQHENMQEDAREEMTAHERMTHERRDTQCMTQGARHVSRLSKTRSAMLTVIA